MFRDVTPATAILPVVGKVAIDTSNNMEWMVAAVGLKYARVYPIGGSPNNTIPLPLRQLVPKGD